MPVSEKQIILVCGVTGSGKSTFSSCFKNSFLRGLPLLSLSEGIAKDISFYIDTNLANKTQFALLQKARENGYRVTAYYLFTGRLLSQKRAEFRELASDIPFDLTLFKRSYESSYKGLGDLFSYADLIFFLRNQEKMEFLSAYDIPKSNRKSYLDAIKRLKQGVDSLR